MTKCYRRGGKRFLWNPYVTKIETDSAPLTYNTDSHSIMWNWGEVSGFDICSGGYILKAYLNSYGGWNIDVLI